MALIDLRSDTVTKPSEAMRKAMYDAEVGDDWYGDDPTVRRLTERAAELLGKEAAAFIPTGTMANQIAMHLHVGSGHSAICEEWAHVGDTEQASSSVLSGLSFRRVSPSEHRITAADIAPALEPDWYKFDVVDLVCIENSHQAGGGLVMPLAEVEAIREVANQANTPVHLDGARLFNAAAAGGYTAAQFASNVDTVMCCLSKGLGAPIGSMLVGPADFIEESWRVRVLFGGGWRQAGILAAAGLVALEEGPGRLHEDHARARRLAEGVADILPEADADADAVQMPETNIVFVDVEAAGMPLYPTIERLHDENIAVVPISGNVRMVTHVDIDDEAIDKALEGWRAVVKETR